jgi:hypothetical protein
MATAALILGILGGLFGLFVGLFGYGIGAIAGVGGFQIISIAIPIAALVGGGMAKANPAVGGGLMLASTIGMLWIFGFNFFTAIPVVLTGVGGALALMAASEAKTKAEAS